MRKFKGQSATEFGVIGSVVLGVCLIGVFFFGDSLADLFDGNTGLSIFNNNRVASKVDSTELLSDVSLSKGSTHINSPVESVIRENLLNGNIQTSGSSGQITETLSVYLGYAANLSTLLRNLKNSNPGLNTSNAERYAKELAQYAASFMKTNGLDANGATSEFINQMESLYPGFKAGLQSMPFSGDQSLKDLATSLDISINLDQNGTAATNFKNAIDTLANSISDPATKSLISMMASDMLNLGRSLDFRIDSRLVKDMGLENYQTDLPTISTSIANKIENMNKNGLSTSVKRELTAIVDELKSVEDLNDIDKINSCLQRLDQIIASNNIPDYTNQGISGRPSFNNDQGMVSFTTNASPQENIELTGGYQKVLTTYTPYPIDISPIKITNYPNLPGALSIIPGIGSLDNYVVFDKYPYQPDNKIYLVDKSSYSGSGYSNSINQNGFRVIEVTLSSTACHSTRPSSCSATAETYAYNKYSAIAEAKNELEAVSAQTLAMKRDILEYVNEIANNPNMTAAQKAEYAKRIEVYRNGNYTDIMPDSYNGKALCESLGLEIKDNTCSIS